MYPALAKKYGPVVTYQEKPSAHMKVEYGFDVDQVAEGHYAPKAYHDFVGFEVSKPVLERAFITLIFPWGGVAKPRGSGESSRIESGFRQLQATDTYCYPCLY